MNREAMPSSPTRLNVVLIEDVKEVREGSRLSSTKRLDFVVPPPVGRWKKRSASPAISRADVVLTDIGLPGMSGIDGIRVLQQRWPHVPIVALTVTTAMARSFRRSAPVPPAIC